MYKPYPYPYTLLNTLCHYPYTQTLSYNFARCTNHTLTSHLHTHALCHPSYTLTLPYNFARCTNRSLTLTRTVSVTPHTPLHSHTQPPALIKSIKYLALTSPTIQHFSYIFIFAFSPNTPFTIFLKFFSLAMGPGLGL